VNGEPECIGTNTRIHVYVLLNISLHEGSGPLPLLAPAAPGDLGTCSMNEISITLESKTGKQSTGCRL
jgi:hypothetical protein